MGNAIRNSGEQADQRAPRPARRGRVARPQDRRAQILLGLVVEGQKGQQREIAPAVVVPVEERELLRAVGRIIGRVEIDRDAPGAPMEPLPMALDHARGEFAAHRVELVRSRRSFSNREIVGCEASASPSIGSRPSRSL